MHQVVITGAGVVSPIGTTLAEFGRRMFAGDSGAVDIRGKLVAYNFPVPVAAPIFDELTPSETPDHHAYGNLPRSLRVLGMATENAIRSLPQGLPINGVVVGGPVGTDSEINLSCAADPGLQYGSWLPPANFIRDVLKQRGHGQLPDRELISINNLTVSSNQAIGLGFQRVRWGLWERAVVSAVYGGWGAKDLMNFHLLGTLSTDQRPATQVSRPFSATRSGFVLGEGAATLILEERIAAERRGATILGSITGYATTSDSYRMTDGRPDVRAAAAAMKEAVRDAGLENEQINAISAHGTSTRMNDRLETLAIKKAFGQAAKTIPVISLKSQIGHCLAAAGALEAVASLLMLAEQKLAPTINCTEPDPECDLDYVANGSRPAKLQRILSNNFGFGGQNSCVVFERD